MAVDNVSAILPQIAGAIRQAASTTGASFEYLLTTAQIESHLNPGAQATTSSAGGLYQFIDQTWLATVKNTGAAFGLGQYSQAIVQAPDGHFEVPNTSARSAIMKLRSDPNVSAVMAGAFARNNAAQLASSLGRQPSEAELYVAHFLGADGAGKLISAAVGNPQANAAAMFPQAAAANHTIFYDGAGRPRSAAQVYGQLTGRFDVARALTFSDSKAAQPVPDTAGMTRVLAAANANVQQPVKDTRPLFESIFTDRAGMAMSPSVTSLWAPTGATATPTGPISPDKGPRTLDLFTDGKPDLRGMFGAS
jgi:hypothetical protein